MVLQKMNNPHKTPLYPDAQSFLNAPRKTILFFGMSGLGKSHLAQMLRYKGNKSWFHYSVDYRIGTRYLGEHIVDNFKEEAMKNPFLRQLLCSDSLYIASNITFDNLAPLSAFLGKPGNPDLGGLNFEEYNRRQQLHRQAEINAMLDVGHFIERAKRLYDYPHFVCDSSGSLVEIVNGDDPLDPVLSYLHQHCLLIWLKGNEAHQDMLVERFQKAPKPMYYQEDILQNFWQNYLAEKGIEESQVHPDDFIIWGYRRLLENRQPRYQKIAQNWGITLEADEVQNIQDSDALMALIAEKL